jgi:hypothetical protein
MVLLSVGAICLAISFWTRAFAASTRAGLDQYRFAAIGVVALVPAGFIVAHLAWHLAPGRGVVAVGAVVLFVLLVWLVLWEPDRIRG